MKYPQFHFLETGMAAKCSNGVTMTTEPMVHMRKHRKQRHAYAHHRKSAVELLEASKGEYVKSRQVLNHKQELKHPENLSISSEPVQLCTIQTRQIALEDESNTLDESTHRKTSVEETSSSTTANSSQSNQPQNENRPRSLSQQSSLIETVPRIRKSSEGSQSLDEHDGLFKKPQTPPKLPPKPVVPPRSCSKPTTPPVPGPKPAILNTSSDNTGKPVPPPRPSRVQFDNSSKMSSAATDKSGASATTVTNGSDKSDMVSKRFSSLSAHATVGKESSDRDSSSDKNGPHSGRDRDARSSISSQNDGVLKPLCSTNLSTSVGVLLERTRSPIPKPRIEKQINEYEMPRRRQLHRSHSDLSSCRHSRASSDFSDLSSRLSRTSTEVERFFNEMGIDRTVLEPMRKLAETRQRDKVQDSVSSLGSVSGQSFSSRLSHNDLDKVPMESEQDLMERSASGSTSVVERNARIIKWLCNVKKARTAPGHSSAARQKPSTSS